jgi:hypothetical protein
MYYRFVFLVLLAGILSPGCAYNNYNRQFFADCRTKVPAIRVYAVSHLATLSDDDKRIIDTTEPKLAQANYVDVHFTWPNVCMVDSGTPPNCEPFKVVDLRQSK